MRKMAMSALARAKSALDWALASWRRLLAVLAGLGVAAFAGGLLFAWLGVYNVAASTGHWRIVDMLLRFGMENSVKARAPDATLPPQDNEDRVRLGAGHFHAGCAYCHGAPGIPISPVAAQMLPPPPDLKGRVARWRDGELFWLVKHGLKYAGMPGWPAIDREDEVWAMVAFLRRLPTLDRESYGALAMGEVEREPESGQEIATGQSAEGAIGACARCHGGDALPPSRLVPILHGQPPDMLAAALRAYRSGERASGVMQTAAAGLSDRAIARLADFYARLPRPEREPARPGDSAAVARGEAMARDGLPANGVPSCLGCHGPDAVQSYPRLAGQPARYLEGQLAAWRAGLNDNTPTGMVMAPIARRLTPVQSAELAAYFESLPFAMSGATR
jgi:cytochrome c553